MIHRRVSALAVAASLGSFAATARAQLDASAFARALAMAQPGTAWPAAFVNARAGRVSFVVRRTPNASVDSGLTPLVGDLSSVSAQPADVPALIAAHPEWGFAWSPGRHLLMDRAQVWTRAAAYREHTGGTGRGVIVGIVDSGVDVTHPDLRDVQGNSRVLRFLDFSRAPAGFEPDLESSYDCTKNADCAVFSGADIDALIANNVIGDEPRDAVGHGTHVASLAAGGGRADPRYVGIAPEATLIAARVTGADGSVQDDDILRAVRFVFGEADRLGMPAVVNLSLGSDFGGHDGTSPLEVGLADFVGANHPGHAIVVAAGNSAGMLRNLSSDYPGPFGIHTEVHVPRESSVRVPILSPPVGRTVTQATIFAWVAFRPGDDVSVGFDDSSGTFTAPIAPGHVSTNKRGDVEVTLYNGGGGADVDPSQRNAAVVMIDGKWASGSVFALRFEGHGTAEIWLQSEGDLGPDVSGLGALVPRASKEETINVPASAPSLIAVGASTNRVDWTDVDGESVRMADNGALDDSPLDSIAYFSSGGPNTLGTIKPDIVAPGYHVIGAMSSLADPRLGGGGLFDGTGVCLAYSDACMVVSPRYAVAAGTSMATPIVSGAVALLFERDPTLDQSHVRTLLQAGARRLEGVIFDGTQAGPGALDLEGTRRVIESNASSATGQPVAEKSWLTLASPLIRPDPAWRIEGLVTLRDADGLPADGFDAARLELDVDGATVASPLARQEAGLYAFDLAGLPNTGQGRARVTVRFDGEVIADREVPVAVDHTLASGGVRARGGCSITGPTTTRFEGWMLAGVGLLLCRRRRAHSFVARGA